MTTPSAVTYCGLGVALAEQGRMGEAVDRFHRAIELAPNYATAHLNLGTAYMHLGTADEAVRHFEIAHSLHPDSLTRRLLKQAKTAMENGKEAP